jgi:hypothetical protein
MRKQTLVLSTMAAVAAALLFTPASGWAQPAPGAARPAEVQLAAPDAGALLPALAGWLPAWLNALRAAPGGSGGPVQVHAAAAGSGGGSGGSGTDPGPTPCTGLCDQAGLIGDPDG